MGLSRATISLLLLPLAPLLALDYPVPSTPQTVTTETIGDRTVEWVDWGAAGTAQRRDAQSIADEADGLQRFLHSPEVMARLAEIAQLGEAKETELLRARLAQWQVAYHTVEQPTGFPRRQARIDDEVPLPQWAWGLPEDIRRSTQVLIFDDRDPVQREWVLAQGSTGERLTYAYCTGWKSGADRDAFWAAHPGVPVSPIATDQFTVFYGVVAYPARIRFGTETMAITQGVDP